MVAYERGSIACSIGPSGADSLVATGDLLFSVVCKHHVVPDCLLAVLKAAPSTTSMGMGVWMSFSEFFCQMECAVQPLRAELFLIVTSPGVKADDEKPWVPMGKAPKVQSTTCVQRMATPNMESVALETVTLA